MLGWAGEEGGGGEEYVAIQDQKELHLIFFSENSTEVKCIILLSRSFVLMLLLWLQILTFFSFVIAATSQLTSVPTFILSSRVGVHHCNI